MAYVADGDTVRLTNGVKVRLVRIDAPELYTDCYGQAARRALLRLTHPGSRVTLICDPSLDDRDPYGRLLRYTVVRAKPQLRAGGGGSRPALLLPQHFFHNDRGLHAEELLQAARRARSRRLGLWGACPGARLDSGLGAVTGPA